MWIKDKIFLKKRVESTILTKDFLVAEGSRLGFSFLDAQHTPFGRGIFVPGFWILKVHRNHPIRVFSGDYNQLHVRPVGDERMLGQIYEDKMAHDLTSFLLLPYSLPKGFENKFVKQFSLRDGFVKNNGEKSDASLVYIVHHDSVGGGNDSVFRYSFVPPAQVTQQLYAWLVTQRHEIYSHEKTFSQRLEGEVRFPSRPIRNAIMSQLTETLEKRYKTRFTFERSI